MDNLENNIVLEDLEQYNKELSLEEYQMISLNNYNSQFRNKILNCNNTLNQEEKSYLKNIENISIVIEQNKKLYSDVIEEQKKLNLIKYDETNSFNREMYDKELKKINDKINSYSDLFDKQVDAITSSTYYKKLDINQTNNDYDKYLSDIKKNYNDSVEFYHSRKSSKLESLKTIEKKSKIELEGTLDNIEKLFNNGNFHDSTSKNIKIKDLNTLIEENEKDILKKKMLIDSQIEKISNKYKVLLELDITPIKSHIGYLKQQASDFKQELKEEEIKCLDTFKLNLEIIDKQIEIHKLKTTKRIEEINILMAHATSIELNSELAEIEHSTLVLTESMRAKKIEYDIKKTYEIELLHLKYNKNKDKLNNSISLYQKRISALENINNFNEYIQCGKLRNDMEIQELRIKNELDNLKQRIYLVESIEKLSIEFYNSIHKYQKELHGLSIEYNDGYYNTIKNKITTLTSLEIEKSLILKKYNTKANQLLVKKQELYLQIIKIEEQNDISLTRLSNDLDKKILSQDIQFANKKFELLKNLNLLEKDFNDRNVINEYNYKLSIKTYNVFENRFSIEKNLYKIYFDNIKNLIESTELYFNKYNNITNCTNTNISFATFNYLTSYLKTNVISLLKKTINVISNRITFEGTINFQYELNRLISDKEQNETSFNTSIEKIEETIANYEKTIILYKDKIENLHKEADLVKNQLIIKDLDIAHCDVKNSNLIKILHEEVEILTQSHLEYNKEIKVYKELIIKNKKLIADFNKLIPNIKTKYNKTATNITNQLNTIEKRHKQESSVYYNFINKIESLIKDINQEFNIDNIKDTVYLYFKKYTSSIYSSVLSFEENYIVSLFTKLSLRHDDILEDANNKYIDLVEDTKDTYLSDNKRLTSTYTDTIYEIEKKIEKIYSIFEIKKKESNNILKDKTYDLKQKIKEIEIEQNQSKATMLFNINSFTENIDEYNSINDKNIDKLKTDRSNLTKKYFEFNESLNKEKMNKQKHLESKTANVITSLKQTYESIIEEKEKSLKEKVLSYKIRIDESSKVFKQSIVDFNLKSSVIDTEFNLTVETLNKNLENDLYSLKKSSITKINKENRKFIKIKKNQ